MTARLAEVEILEAEVVAMEQQLMVAVHQNATYLHGETANNSTNMSTALAGLSSINHASNAGAHVSSCAAEGDAMLLGLELED